jgi:phosphate transport system substrate-binding protein
VIGTHREGGKRRPSSKAAVLLAGFLLAALVAGTSAPSSAEDYQKIVGEGSSWAANAIDAMRVNVSQFGIEVAFNSTGSTSGRKNFLNGTVDFAASDIPFQFKPEDGSAPENPAPGSYAYMPITAGGTAFMYNLIINGKQVTNLRLSGENVTKLFTGVITQWNDPAIAADNPGLVLPARKVVPVVRSDGSGATAQLTLWMIDRFPALWTDYCNRSGRAPACGSTSFYPAISGMIGQAGDTGVSTYVSAPFGEGAIGYVNYSYAIGAGFPVVKMLNAAGYYTEPTPQNVAVSLLKAKINTNENDPSVYLTQDLRGVYTDTDPRNYQLSSYSYLILPTKIGGQFNEAKGKTLAAFSYYAMCQAQQQSASLGYSPMPINLVQASLDQITKVPGAVVQDINLKDCKNPTFSSDGTNVLAATAPQPQACDKQGPSQCPNGTAGAAGIPTAVAAPAAGAPAPAAGGSAPAAGGGIPPAGGGAPAAGGGTPVAGSVAPAGGGTPAGGSVAPAGGDTPAVDGSVTAGLDPATGATVPAEGAVVVLAPTGNGVDAAGQPSPTCDPDTGLCGAGTGAGAVAAAAVGGVVPTVLSPSAGSGSSTALVFIIVVFTLAVVLVPALAWRRLSQPGSA